MLVYFAGLAAVIVPMLYAFAMIAAWAMIRSVSIRRGALLIMGAIAIVVPGRLALELQAASSREEALATHCASGPAPQIDSQARGARAVLADYDYYRRFDDGPTQTGELAFPLHVASRLLLSGVKPLERFAVRADDGFEIHSIGPDSGELIVRQKDTPRIQHAYSWVSNDLSRDESVASATLVVMDLTSREVLGTLPVFVTISPELKAFPSLWSTPTPVQAESVHSCPRAEEIAGFLSGVLNSAGLRAARND